MALGNNFIIVRHFELERHLEFDTLLKAKSLSSLVIPVLSLCHTHVTQDTHLKAASYPHMDTHKDIHKPPSELSGGWTSMSRIKGEGQLAEINNEVTCRRGYTGLNSVFKHS